VTAGIILFAHGSREPEWAVPFEALAHRVAAESGAARVAVAYLELLSPTLEEAVASLVASGAGDITIAPIFLAPGGHVKRDLPRIVAGLRARYPAASFRILKTIGESDAILAAMASWIVGEASSSTREALT
jgi:sirohydrochlorin cobaltochelatase